MTPEELALSQGLKTTSRTHRAMLPAVTCRNELAVLRELAVSSKESLSEYPAPEEVGNAAERTGTACVTEHGELLMTEICLVIARGHTEPRSFSYIHFGVYGTELK